MDTIRAKQILQSQDSIQVLFNGSPVWIENVNGDNQAEITDLDSQRRQTVPVYKLVENSPVK